jgi:hypothetical protein
MGKVVGAGENLREQVLTTMDTNDVDSLSLHEHMLNPKTLPNTSLDYHKNRMDIIQNPCFKFLPRGFCT